MRYLRFIYYLIGPWLQPLLIVPLIILWLIFTIVLGIWGAWDKANGK